MELTGTVAMITGAGRGIGRAIALAYARAGADLAVASLEAQEVADLKQEVDDLPREAGALRRRMVAHVADVAQESAVARFVAAATAEFGQIDVLINNAGTILLPQDVRAMSVEAWDRMMAVNVRSVFLCARAVLPGMIERRRGRIINIASTAGLRGLADRAAYCASKHAVVGFTRALALDAKPYGIAVNAICPGAVDTALTAYARPDADKTSWMQPDDVAGVALFLATAAASAMTGAVIEVAGWSG